MKTELKQLKLFAWTVIAETRNLKTLLSVACIYLAALVISLLIGEISIAETRESQVAICAAFLRLAVTFFLALFTINSIVRDINDRMLLLYLSLPISRAIFVLGKFIGFACFSLILGILATLLVSLYSGFQVACLWGLSLFFECCLVIGFSLLCAFSFAQVTSAFSAVAGIYILSRTMPAILMMAHNPLRPIKDSISKQFADGLLTTLDYLLPRLDVFTQSKWLMYQHITTADIKFIMLQTIVYLTLLLSIAFFDFYRKNI